jgi:hypothetical protein
MRKMLSATLVFVFLFAISLSSAKNMLSAGETDVQDVIAGFVKDVDTRNADALSKTVISNGSIVVYNSLLNKFDTYSGSQFVDLVRNGQKGGWERNVAVSSIEVNGNTATAKVDITDPRLKETGYVTLINDNGTWKLTSEVATLSLNK